MFIFMFENTYSTSPVAGEHPGFRVFSKSTLPVDSHVYSLMLNIFMKTLTDYVVLVNVKLS